MHIVRKANACDFDEILEIWKAENLNAHSFIAAEYWKQNLVAVRSALPRAEVFVCDDTGAVAGFVGLNGNHIEGIFVKASRQRSGIGKALLDKAKTIKPTLTLNVYQKNSNALRFYRRNGFCTVSEGVDENTGEDEIRLQWQKPLS